MAKLLYFRTEVTRSRFIFEWGTDRACGRQQDPGALVAELSPVCPDLSGPGAGFA